MGLALWIYFGLTLLAVDTPACHRSTSDTTSAAMLLHCGLWQRYELTTPTLLGGPLQRHGGSALGVMPRLHLHTFTFGLLATTRHRWRRGTATAAAAVAKVALICARLRARRSSHDKCTAVMPPPDLGTVLLSSSLGV